MIPQVPVGLCLRFALELTMTRERLDKLFHDSKLSFHRYGTSIGEPELYPDFLDLIFGYFNKKKTNTGSWNIKVNWQSKD